MAGGLVVTGGSGFVGRQVLDVLGRRGIENVHCFAHHSSLPGVPPTWTISHGSIDQWDGAHVGNGYTILHLARLADASAASLRAVNDHGARRVAEVAIERRARVVALSSAEVYGPGPHRRADPAELEVAPRGLVGETIAAGDRALLTAGATLLRPHLVYGPGDLGLGLRMVSLADAVGLVDGGRAEHTAIHVMSLAEIIVTLALSVDPPDGVLVVGEDRPQTVESLVSRLAPATAGRASITLAEALDHPAGRGDPRWRADLRRITTENTFDVGRFLEWTRARGDTTTGPSSLAGERSSTDDEVAHDVAVRVLGEAASVPDQLVVGILAALAEVHARLGSDVGATQGLVSPYAVGRERAAQDVPPAFSIEAARSLFDVALPRLVGLYPQHRPYDVASCLHQVILRRVTAASISYVDTLLERVSRANQEERSRAAREMHDVVAHEIGIGVIFLELRLLEREGLPPDVREELASIQERLRVATDHVRSIASNLRDVVGDRTLTQALEDYVGAVTPPGMDVDVRVELGDIALPTFVVEQVYLVVREAIRNAILHGYAGRLGVGVTLVGGDLIATVVDDGRGFDPGQVPAGSTGLASMQERAAAFDGRLELLSVPGLGASVSLYLPIGELAHG